LWLWQEITAWPGQWAVAEIAGEVLRNLYGTLRLSGTYTVRAERCWPSTPLHDLVICFMSLFVSVFFYL
jgi:hypothetical protein